VCECGWGLPGGVRGVAGVGCRGWSVGVWRGGMESLGVERGGCWQWFWVGVQMRVVVVLREGGVLELSGVG
jgi:hypothetical protein